MQAFKGIKKGLCLEEDRLRKEKNYKVLALLFTKYLEQSDIPENWNNTVMILQYKIVERM